MRWQRCFIVSLTTRRFNGSFADRGENKRLNTSDDKVTCKECGSALNEPTDGSLREPCPTCGSLKRRFEKNITASVDLRGGIIADKYLAGKSKKKGLVLRRKIDLPTHRVVDGLPVRENQLVDRENDRYAHEITDEGGVVLYESPPGERLSEHRGHGSVKKKKG